MSIYNTFHKVRLFHVLSRNLLTEKFIVFRLAYGLIKKLNLSFTTRRNGREIKILVKNGIGLMNVISGYEKWLDTLFTRIIQTGDPVIVDVGANVGQTMLTALSRFPCAQYIAIEPNGQCAVYLEALVRLNRFNTVRVFESALSNAEGDGQLLLRYDDDILATTTHGFRKFTKYAKIQNVRVVTGDALLADLHLDTITVIKIDIEGGEANAIDGLLQTITKFQPWIICEILPLKTEDEEVTACRILAASRIFDRMKVLDYAGFNIIDRKWVACTNDLSASLESCNYLFMPAAKTVMFPEQNKPA